MLSPELRRPLYTAARACAVVGSAVSTVVIGAGVVDRLGSSPTASWLLGRAAGLTSYLLLVALVLTGLVLSHPAAARLRRPNRLTRIRLHLALATFTLVFTVLHVVVLATDTHAGVGWSGALLPLSSQYRPVPVTLGVLALWSGLLTGVTAALAGRIAGRLWWPLHKVAVMGLALAWAHGLFAGSDSPALVWLYLSTGMAVLLAGITRHTAVSSADEVRGAAVASRVSAAPVPLGARQ